MPKILGIDFLLSLYEKHGYNCATVASELNVTRKTVSRWIRTLGAKVTVARDEDLPREGPGSNWSRKEIVTARDLRLQGASYATIGAQIKRSPAAVQRKLTRMARRYWSPIHE